MNVFFLLLNVDIFYLSKDLRKVANSQFIWFITKLLTSPFIIFVHPVSHHISLIS